MDIVYSSKVQRVGPDKVCWKPAGSRGFEVRGFHLSFFPFEVGVAIERSSKGGFLFMINFFR